MGMLKSLVQNNLHQTLFFSAKFFDFLWPPEYINFLEKTPINLDEQFHKKKIL